jgi:formamidopyrimidine-DNA glycosylase
MPELPEVEITRRAVAPYMEGKRVMEVIARTGRLRLPVTRELLEELPGRTILKVERRGKYILMRTTSGTVILHLGMSGYLSIVPSAVPPGKHDHLDFILETGLALRFTDPRRFGLALWTDEEPFSHPLLKEIGPEPLENGFDGDYLFHKSRNRELAIKQFIMESHIVAGVGNIYANEALFRAGINPAGKAGGVSRARCRRLANSIREMLSEAIMQGESALQVLSKSEAGPVYFPVKLDIYGREGKPCCRCGSLIQRRQLGQRSTYFCITCQK